MFVAPAAEYAPAAEEVDGSSEIEEAGRLGLLLDTPLCRYSWCLLPGHQIVMSVWQPQYTLMFDKLLGQPGPHYYFHVLLPGGAESLGEPGYELEPGTKSALMGTLCRISVARRNPDSTLTLVVQGLTRGIVLRATQTLPYSRGDVQLLPDAEALLEGARAAQRHLRAMAPDGGPVSAAARMRLTAAAAAIEAKAHFDYEAVALSVDAGGNLAPLNQLNATAAASLSQVEAAVGEALREAPMSPPEAQDSLYQGSRAAEDLRAAIEAAEAAEEAEAAEAAEALLALEVQVWLELDDLLQVTVM